MIKALSYFPVSKTHGYAVVGADSMFRIQFGQMIKIDGEMIFKSEGQSTSMGRIHYYETAELAENVIKREIMPIYG